MFFFLSYEFNVTLYIMHSMVTEIYEELKSMVSRQQNIKF